MRSGTKESMANVRFPCANHGVQGVSLGVDLLWRRYIWCQLIFPIKLNKEPLDPPAEERVIRNFHQATICSVVNSSHCNPLTCPEHCQWLE